MKSKSPPPELVKNLWAKNIPLLSPRDGFGRGVIKAGERNKKVMVLSADLGESTRAFWFKEKFPERFVEVGVAEQNMASLAAGMALLGKVVFITSFAVFSPGRNNEQIRTTISYNSWGSVPGKEINVKIVGAHAGLSTGADGATHQALEDVALMRVQPGMNVIVPCDAQECEKATLAAAEIPGPVYLRFGRVALPQFTTVKTPFKVGRIEEFRSGEDCTIIANGPMVYQALLAAKKLENEIDCQVLNCHTIKPLDEKTLLKAVQKTGCAVTAEEHQVKGGLGSVISEYLSENFPVPIMPVGIKDQFGESGTPEQLWKKYGLTAEEIIKAVRASVKMKKCFQKY